MKLSALLPYFGGKRSMAPDIVAELGPHSAYWEPFCGSMAVLLAKPVSGHETVNDLHGDVINLARVVASDRAPELYDRLQRTLYDQDLFAEARAIYMEQRETPELPCVDRAYWYFIVSWMGRNGVSGTARTNYQMAVRWTPHGGGGGQRFRNAVDSIPAWHTRLRNVTILRRDAFELLEKIEDVAGVVIFADPPYILATRAGGGGSRYLHDFKTDADHNRLAELLKRFRKARVVVSYYDDSSLDGLYPGWTKADHTRNKNLHVQNRRGIAKADAPEVLLINGESYACEETEALLF